ncbi:MAG: aldo/keto reductase [Pseudomonadota bacterium]
MRLSLGTAQFGLNYGITNAAGQVTPEAAAHILKTALHNGVTVLDTAVAYGNAETTLAQHRLLIDSFAITSKIPSLADCDGLAALQKLQQHARQSKTYFGGALKTLLFHDAQDVLRPEGQMLWGGLETIAAELGVEHIGISVYDKADIDDALARITPDVVQLPFSVFDQRLLSDGSLDKLATYGCAIEARSVFLQGLVLCAPERIPYHLRGLVPASQKLHAEARSAGVEPLDIALGFLRLTQRFDRAVIGVTNARELGDICSAFKSPIPSVSYPNFRVFDATLLDPRRWPGLMEEKRAS